MYVHKHIYIYIYVQTDATNMKEIRLNKVFLSLLTFNYLNYNIF